MKTIHWLLTTPPTHYFAHAIQWLATRLHRLGTKKPKEEDLEKNLHLAALRNKLPANTSLFELVQHKMVVGKTAVKMASPFELWLRCSPPKTAEDIQRLLANTHPQTDHLFHLASKLAELPCPTKNP